MEQLFTFGLNVEYERGGFEFGGEVAFNRGQQTVHAIDRMKVILKRDGYAGINDLGTVVVYNGAAVGNYVD